ncbi:hypothetical protein DFW101_1099 [Solidesulfovibrio carbinoliphilus subsp. oakridgensis]|uniref:Lipoprotein n=1 Tax=Solidesulfovibrio carbinoliphilus subsp. oakridgensis TaxID=694327 RepID=G7Q7F7_9BACT|nr:hypothetical protein [Solidesulfovibrio carbinoliphilus]EHJ47110.1 hypothetical protein DFW101_1099 [Solidesulfovibrio carbinoliphilus subsp. oakridgensis]
MVRFALPALLALLLWAVLSACPAAVALAAPPGPADLARFIETSKKTIADYEKTILAYDAEMRATVANDPASARRREEIRILKQYYVHEIEGQKAKIADSYAKIQDFRTRGIQ